MMFKLDRSDIQRMGGAALGALILTATSVGAAVGPARIAETSPVAVVQVQAPGLA